MSSISETTKTRLRQWSEKLGIPLEDLQKQFDEKLAQLKRIYPAKDMTFWEPRARFFLYRELKTQVISPAIFFDAVFLGYSAKMDMLAPYKRTAIETYQKDPDRAIREGLTDAEGRPLDNRPTITVRGREIKNPNIGKPLGDIWVRQSVGIGKPLNRPDIKLLILVHWGDQADLVPPLGQILRTRGNLQADEPERYIFNTSVTTRFDQPSSLGELSGQLTTEKICELLQTAPETFKTDLAHLQAYHTRTANDRRRIVIVEGDVIYIRREPTRIGNSLLVIEDESIGYDLESPGITVWVHPELIPFLDFAAGSRVLVIGRTVEGPAFDPTTRQIDATKRRVMINAFGIFAIPELRIPPEEEFETTVIEETSGSETKEQ